MQQIYLYRLLWGLDLREVIYQVADWYVFSQLTRNNIHHHLNHLLKYQSPRWQKRYLQFSNASFRKCRWLILCALITILAIYPGDTTLLLVKSSSLSLTSMTLLFCSLEGLDAFFRCVQCICTILTTMMNVKQMKISMGIPTHIVFQPKLRPWGSANEKELKIKKHFKKNSNQSSESQSKSNQSPHTQCFNTCSWQGKINTVFSRLNAGPRLNAGLV